MGAAGSTAGVPDSGTYVQCTPCLHFCRTTLQHPHGPHFLRLTCPVASPSCACTSSSSCAAHSSFSQHWIMSDSQDASSCSSSSEDSADSRAGGTGSTCTHSGTM